MLEFFLYKGISSGGFTLWHHAFVKTIPLSTLKGCFGVKIAKTILQMPLLLGPMVTNYTSVGVCCTESDYVCAMKKGVGILVYIHLSVCITPDELFTYFYFSTKAYIVGIL